MPSGLAAVWPDQSYRPPSTAWRRSLPHLVARPSARYKDALAPPLFQQLFLPFPPPLHVPAQAPSCLRPQASASSTYSLRGPDPQPNDTTRPVRKYRSTTAGSHSLDASAALSRRPSDRASTLGNGADEAPDVPAGRGDLSPEDLRCRTTVTLFQPSSTSPSYFLKSPPRSARLRQQIDWLRHHRVTTALSFCRSPPRLVWGRGRRAGIGADCAATRPINKIPHAQPRAPSRITQRLVGAGSK